MKIKYHTNNYQNKQLKTLTNLSFGTKNIYKCKKHIIAVENSLNYQMKLISYITNIPATQTNKHENEQPLFILVK